MKRRIPEYPLRRYVHTENPENWDNVPANQTIEKIIFGNAVIGIAVVRKFLF